VQELLPFEKSSLESTRSKLTALIQDPGNRDKGKKYSYALSGVKIALDKTFPTWSDLNQLAELTPHSEFARLSYCVLNALKISSDSDIEIRIQYAYILDNLRKALTIGPDLDALNETHTILRHLCHYKFTQVQMYPFFEDFISKALRAPQREGDGYEVPKLRFSNLAVSIFDANQRLGSIPPEYQQTVMAKQAKKLLGTLGLSFDPTADSNTPWIHSLQTIEFGVGQTKIITVLRHGTPTQDPNITNFLAREVANIARSLAPNWISHLRQAKVIAEYEAHLQADPSKMTLYVNHQEHDEQKEHALHGEGDRSLAIQELEQKFNNFFFLALPLDGYFWKQSNLPDDAEALINALHTSALKGTHGFALPAKAKQLGGNLEADIGDILRKVHSLYFEKKGYLEFKERKVFIMLFYSELKDYFKMALGIDFIVSACKDNKDRGNASAIVDMVKNLVKLKKQNDEEALQEIFFTALAPFIIKNEFIIHERIMLALDVINFFHYLSPTRKEAIAEDRSFPIVAQRVPKEAAGWAEMMGPKSFLQAIDGTRERNEKRHVKKPHIHQALEADYKQNGVWNLQKLKLQICKDIPRIDLKVNVTRVESFEFLCEKIEISPDLFNENVTDASLTGEQRKKISWMTLMQQGIAAEAMTDAHNYLKGNKAGMVVAQTVPAPGILPTQISIAYESGFQGLRLIQAMELKNPGSLETPRPIQLEVNVNPHFLAKMSWHFVKST
jgi:hypothetical protein